MSSPIVLRLFQASTFIPKSLGYDFLLSDQELLEEVTRITDHASEKIINSERFCHRILCATINR